MSMFLTTDGPIRFPGLGITIEKLSEGFEIFGLHISLSGILLAVALFLGLFVTERLAKKSGQNTEDYLDLAIRVVVAGLLGARIGYVLSHWEIYVADQASVFDLGSGGLSFEGALLAGLATAFVYCKQKKLSWLKVCDTALPGVVLAQMIGTLGNFIERHTLGTFSDGVMAMQVALCDVETEMVTKGRSSGRMLQGDFLQVHPIAIYQFVFLAGLLVLLALTLKKQKISGIVLGVYMVMYGIICFFLDFITLDAVPFLYMPFSLEQITAICIAAFGFTLIYNQSRKHTAECKSKPKNISKK